MKLTENIMKVQPTSFALKSATLSMLVLHLKLDSMETIRTDFQALLRGNASFFKDEFLCLDFELLKTEQITHALTDEFLNEWLLFLKELGFRVLFYAATPPDVKSKLNELSLYDCTEHISKRTLNPFKITPHLSSLSIESEGIIKQTALPLPATESPVFDQPPEFCTYGSMVIESALRSGQQVYAKNQDLIILSSVNPGAEIISDGNIHIYGELRGRAIAGASGNKEARIFARSMAPQLISIAGVYQTGEDAIPSDSLFKSYQVRLDVVGKVERLIFKVLG